MQCKSGSISVRAMWLFLSLNGGFWYNPSIFSLMFNAFCGVFWFLFFFPCTFRLTYLEFWHNLYVFMYVPITCIFYKSIRNKNELNGKTRVDTVMAQQMENVLKITKNMKMHWNVFINQSVKITTTNCWAPNRVAEILRRRNLARLGKDVDPLELSGSLYLAEDIQTAGHRCSPPDSDPGMGLARDRCPSLITAARVRCSSVSSPNSRYINWCVSHGWNPHT